MPDPSIPDRLTLLERLAAQQLDVNDQLIAVTRRLGEAHALYETRLDLHAEQMTALQRMLADTRDQVRLQTVRLDLHADQMAALQQILTAIKDLLERRNGP